MASSPPANCAMGLTFDFGGSGRCPYDAIFRTTVGSPAHVATRLDHHSIESVTFVQSTHAGIKFLAYEKKKEW